jgi:hypothetical protein
MYDRLAARRAGLFYLAAAFFYIFGMMYVDGRVRVVGDAAATLRNIAELGPLYRLGFMSTLLGHVCLMAAAAALYELYAPVDAGWARLLVVFVVAGVSISFANRAHQLAVERLALGAYALGAGAGELARVFLDLFDYGEWLAYLFWGLWLFPAGALALKAGFAPKALGVVLIAAGVLYLIRFGEYFFLNPPPAFLAGPLAAVHTADTIAKVAAELGFIGWLLVAGFRRRGS